MEKLPGLIQYPPPGESRLMFCGDCITFTLTLSNTRKGDAWLRTNLGAGSIVRREIINRVEKNEIKLDEAWYDIKMEQDQEQGNKYKIVLPLHQTGFFQAKCFFLAQNQENPVWPPGENSIINVEPAGTCCANIIYNAFVRQFGRFKSGGTEETKISTIVEQLDKQGYTVIPESGKFRDLKKEVEFIFSDLGCRAVLLLPVHPTPTTYARMGRFGSPYAALNFTDVDPALAEFDPMATPLEQFLELADTIHFHNGYLFMDIAINHTGWAASIHETNPEWLVRGEDGKIQAPGAWGVIWADLTKLDYSNTDLWKYMAQIFLLWCHRGVDGFRCDAGYMIPVKAWEYIVARVREEYPETLFFLEGLGGHLKTTRDILNRANFNWAYSELFQNYTREEISNYLPKAYDISSKCGHFIHFAETHDNNRLASVSMVYAKMRTSLCALFSVCGGFGFSNGVEWFATQKIDVHESSSLNWGSKENQVDHIACLNNILKTHPAFFDQTQQALIQKNHSQCLVLLRHNLKYNKRLLVLVNLDCENTNQASWSPMDSNIKETILYDLISGKNIKTAMVNDQCEIQLAPGEVLALSQDPEDLESLKISSSLKSQAPQRVYHQKLKAKVLNIFIHFKGYGNTKDQDLEEQALVFAHDPIEFIRSCNRSFNGDSKESRVIVFDCEKDLKRQVMIPLDFFLLVKCKSGFRAEILDDNRSVKRSLGYEEGIPFNNSNNSNNSNDSNDRKEGEKGFFALFSPKEIKNQHKEYILSLRMFNGDKTLIKKASLLYLAPCDSLYMRFSFTRKEIASSPFLKLLATTRQGGMMRANAWWGSLDSRYDALLAANMDKTTPENRWMVLSRCRIWAVFQGYSRELSLDCLQQFSFSYDHGGKWLFHIPTSEGKYYALELYLELDSSENLVHLSILRKTTSETKGVFLGDDKGVTIIIRPDIEDRSFHETIKAFQGAEDDWPKAVTPLENGFFFSLSNGKTLGLKISKGRFVHEPEWHYMVHRPLEEQRGLDADSDLFSPGYFSFSCFGNEKIILQTRVMENQNNENQNNENQNIENRKDQAFFDNTKDVPGSVEFKKAMPFARALYKSLDAFIVDRQNDKSVIAGYPWFLDWGRDSLIFCRSLIELGRFSHAKAILRLFGRFENQGSLPNMICGQDARNIETSDAPLWFFTCCKDLIEKENSMDFLEEKLDTRSVRNILLSMADSMVKGTGTGVIADPDTMLLYSPSHFTWMDTNYPAATPRQGYPIEIQALWHNALKLLESFDIGNKAKWNNMAQKVVDSIVQLYYNPGSGFFSDCLHCDGPGGAKQAKPDDALRPNQLFLFSLEVIQDQSIAIKCVETCLELLVPGAIRSLAHRKVDYPINIFYNGQLLKDPHAPYSGEYKGDEDTQRKPAYHNGTAWTWLFPVFCEAWANTFGKNSYPTCCSWLGSLIDLMRKGAAGYVPEILDGDFPHTPRGCDAQAWGSSEAARVMHKLLL
jgi:starch synthase (maltosyl-transferring)